MRPLKSFFVALVLLVVPACSDLFGPGFGCHEMERVCLTELSVSETTIYTGAPQGITVGGNDGVYAELLIAPTERGRLSVDDRSVRIDGKKISGNPWTGTIVASWYAQDKTEFNIYVFSMDDVPGVMEYTVYSELRPQLKRKFVANILEYPSFDAALRMEMSFDEREQYFLEAVKKDLRSRGMRDYTLTMRVF